MAPCQVHIGGALIPRRAAPARAGAASEVAVRWAYGSCEARLAAGPGYGPAAAGTLNICTVADWKFDIRTLLPAAS